MGGKNNLVDVLGVDDLYELREKLGPSKVVIVTGPSFGTAIKFILLGAAIGAAGVHFLCNKTASKSHTEDALYEGLAAGGAKDTSNLASRFQSLARRTKNIAGRVRDAAQVVADTARPAIEDAIRQGKDVAQRTEKDLEEELAKE